MGGGTQSSKPPLLLLLQNIILYLQPELGHTVLELHIQLVYRFFDRGFELVLRMAVIESFHRNLVNLSVQELLGEGIRR